MGRITAMIELAKSLRDCEDPNSALIPSTQALDECRLMKFGPAHPHVIAAVFIHADVLIMLRRFTAACELLGPAIQALRAAGSEHLQTLSQLENVLTYAQTRQEQT